MRTFASILVTISLAAVVLLFLPGQVEIFETPKVAVVRACGLALLAGWLLRHARHPSRPSSRLELWLLLLLGLELISTFFSVDPRLSWLGEFRQRGGLWTALGLTGLYLAVRESCAAERWRWIDLILLSGAICSLYALLQATGHDFLRWGGESPVGSMGFVRPIGTAGHPNHLGILLAGLLGLSFSLFWDRPRRRWLTGPLTLLFGLTLLISFSRGGWLGGIAAVGAVVGLHASSLKGLSRGSWWAMGGVAVVAGVGLALTPWGGILTDRLVEMLHPESGSARSRLEIWRSALAMFRSRFWLGSGPDTFALMFPPFQTPQLWIFEWDAWPVHAHNLLLQVAATRGVGALALLALIAVEVARRGRRLAAASGEAAVRGVTKHEGARQRAWLAALAGIFVAALFGSSTVAGLLLMLVALAEIAAHAEVNASEKQLAEDAADAVTERPPRGEAPGGATERPPSGDREGAERRRNLLPVAAMVVVLAAGVGFGALQYQASRLGLRSMLLRRVDAAAASELSRASLRLTAWDEYLRRNHLETLLFALQQGNPAGLREEAQRVGRDLVRRAPLRAQNHQRLGTALLASVVAGDRSVIPQMRREFSRAAALAPWNGLFVSERARALRVAGFADEAFALLSPMARHYSVRGRLWAELAEIELARGHRDAAIRSLRRALAGKWDPQSGMQERAIARLVMLETRESGNAKSGESGGP